MGLAFFLWDKALKLGDYPPDRRAGFTAVYSTLLLVANWPR